MATKKFFDEINFGSSKIHIADPDAVKHKIHMLISATRNKLTVISDFDYTISRYWHDNKRCHTTHGTFEEFDDDKADFQQQVKDLRDKYVAIEYSHTMTIQEKIPYMEEWWRESHNLISKSGVSRHSLKNLVERSRIVPRENSEDLFLLLEKLNVPLVLLSAGIGDVIEHAINNWVGYFPKNVHVVSNFMHFDDEGICSGFSEPLVHTFNKSSTVIAETRPLLFNELRNRNSVLLLGDSHGDVFMDAGLEEVDVSLKIGFLNFDEERLLEQYMAEYDIVLVGEHSMQVPLRIIELIESGHILNGFT